MTIKSKALEVNLASTRVDVDIDPRYLVLQDVFSRYFGLLEGLNTFLLELSHPYRNWRFIVDEARGYALDYFHLLQKHSSGGEAAALLLGVFFDAIEAKTAEDVRVDAVDNLMLYLMKIAREAGPGMDKFVPALEAALDRIHDCDDATFFFFVKGYYSLKRLSAILLETAGGSALRWTPVNRLLHRHLHTTYRYWQQQDDPASWFPHAVDKENPRPAPPAAIFRDISHAAVAKMLHRLTAVGDEAAADDAEQTRALVKLPGFGDFMEAYRCMPQTLFDAGETASTGNFWKAIFLFHTMNIVGLETIHEETLRDINRTLGWLIEHESSRNVNLLLDRTFSILKVCIEAFPTTALNCVLNMGKGVYKTGDLDLIDFFIDSVVDLGFQAPRIGGVGDDWQIQVNPAHIQNIRTWMQIIELNPKRSTRLLSCLIIHLSLCGVFIKDTDLFPRDITRMLNSDIGPVFNLAKQLARLFPVYFNDIGAEGKLRDISTELDESTHRRDILIHFLRKQSHVESSNLIVGFMEAVLGFWLKKDKTVLQPFVPPDIYEQIDEAGLYIDGVHRIMRHLSVQGVSLPADFLKLEGPNLQEQVASALGVDDVDRYRVTLIAEFYKLLSQKYRIDSRSIRTQVESLQAEGFPDLECLHRALAEEDPKKKISLLMDALQDLKKLILSDTRYEIREDIYKKRHFTVDIPSMYGSYHEMKFDALGLKFRIESMLNVLFENLVADIDLNLITKATFFQINDLLKIFIRALKLESISSMEIERQLEMLNHALQVKGLTFTQYLDIFKGFAQCVKNIISDYFNNIHGTNITRILSQIPPEQILHKFLPKNQDNDPEGLVHRVSEIFIRDCLALSLGLQQLDLLLSRVLSTLFHQSNRLPADKLRKLLLYDPKRVITPIGSEDPLVSSLIYLGNKGYNLLQLQRFGAPVPPGFIITTEAFRWRVLINSYQPAEQNFKEQVVREIAALEHRTGLRFGDLDNPLLLSVRSGAAISQPGMMDTFLNVGINEEITERLAYRYGNVWFAWDNYRRFLQGYGMAFGLERDDFDAIISEFKRRWSIPVKRDFTGGHMRKVALTYKRMIEDAGIDIIEDPLEQLFLTIKLVFSSWDSTKARTYRKIMGISDDWGTAVTVQRMIFGNLSQQAGTGVIFTHDPRWSADTLRLWGDFTLGNQGEDVVAGLVTTLPISIFQQDTEMRDTDITLESHFPEIYRELENWAVFLIEEKGWTPQEMEFTFESPRKEGLRLLQTRDMAIRERKKVHTFDLEGVDDKLLLGNGIGVSGGALSGRLVFSLEDIDTWRSRAPGTPMVLVRGDTVPEDIREIFAADALLTARGGVTSHAAVVAHRLEKTCVVGCSNLVVNEKEKTCHFNGHRLGAGDTISIDGQEGSVYQGMIATKES